jgi:phosphoribosylglycinamide formyltransferase-1
MRFVGEPIDPAADAFDPATMSRGEPALPPEFRRRDERLVIARLLRTWRSTKTDRGEAYLARHWFEITTTDGRRAVIYFDRRARAGKPRWWLYTITNAENAPNSP